MPTSIVMTFEICCSYRFWITFINGSKVGSTFINFYRRTFKLPQRDIALLETMKDTK